MLHFEYDLIFNSQSERAIGSLFFLPSPPEYHFRFAYKVECGLSWRISKAVVKTEDEISEQLELVSVIYC